MAHRSYKNYPLYNVRMGSNPIPGRKRRSARMPEWSKGVDLSITHARKVFLPIYIHV
jgi:hypothetical protein